MSWEQDGSSTSLNHNAHRARTLQGIQPYTHHPTRRLISHFVSHLFEFLNISSRISCADPRDRRERDAPTLRSTLV
eukprot:5567156-Prymnesium_polylepis.2